MRVRAVRLGYYDNKRVRPGTVFNIPDAPVWGKTKKGTDGKDKPVNPDLIGKPISFSALWMEEVKSISPAAAPESPADTVDAPKAPKSTGDQAVI